MKTDIYAALSGAQTAWRQLEVISNNLANASTTGFRESRMSFEGATRSLARVGSVRPSTVDGALINDGDPTHFAIRLLFQLPDGRSGSYAFNVGAMQNRSYEVLEKQCTIEGAGKGPFFDLRRGVLLRCNEPTFPAVTADRLALVAASGLPVFRPVFDALTSMGLYKLNPKLIRELQRP